MSLDVLPDELFMSPLPDELFMILVYIFVLPDELFMSSVLTTYSGTC